MMTGKFRADHAGSLLRPGQESGKLKLVADVARATWGAND